jgi:hypothetical protein
VIDAIITFAGSTIHLNPDNNARIAASIGIFDISSIPRQAETVLEF